jgi:hypothetical protein
VVAPADVTPASVGRQHRLLSDVLGLRGTAEAGRQGHQAGDLGEVERLERRQRVRERTPRGEDVDPHLRRERVTGDRPLLRHVW